MSRSPASPSPQRARSASGRWQFWIDRGGTFTDIIGASPDGRLVCRKLLSVNPAHYDDPVIAGIREVLELPAGAAIPPDLVEVVKMGTTVATNALLERHGEPTVLVTTRGFGDALRIGYQNRPELFALRIELPPPLYGRVIEADERVDAQGRVLTPLDTARLTTALAEARDAGFRSVAIVFMHAYRYADHEQQAAALAARLGFQQVSTSHEVAPLIRLVSRGETTVVDAYLSPLLLAYIRSLRAELGQTRLMFMQSSGGLAEADVFRGRDSILSGPAGGVVGMARTAAMAGYSQLIGFDMGGTSTDVSLYEGAFERSGDSHVAGVRIRVPMMRIHTVAAGGGSILKFEDDRLQVGPESAGADPGPACYRNGGPLTITDVNLMLGRIQPDFFPRVFGPGADQPLDRDAVSRGFAELAQRVLSGTGRVMSSDALAAGFLHIAVERMANAIKEISIQRGHDVTEFLLCCFGGAGGQHACRVADALGIRRILVHPLAGVLSAYGMGLADIATLRQRSIERPLEAAHMPAFRRQMERLGRACSDALAGQGIPPERAVLHERAQIRYAGTDTHLAVGFTDIVTMRREFEAAHERRFGFISPDKSLVLGALECEATGSSATPREPPSSVQSETDNPVPQHHAQVWFDDAWRTTPVYRRDALRPGQCIREPALIIEDNATTVVEPGWTARVTALRHLLIERAGSPSARAHHDIHSDPVMLEVFNNLFMNIAEQMGAVLEQTAHSVNIKERLDFSCAVFDPEGGLVANAPHMPVHLGSMSESVRSILAANRDRMAPGDVYMLNAPYNGGTHLPDITVVTPLYDEDGASLRFLVASRGHHADIGGISPGSMPPGSTRVDEEGVRFDNFKLIDKGRFREEQLYAALASGPYPARNPAQNVADLKAQIAANRRGAQELDRIVTHFGTGMVQAYMRHVQDNAETAVRNVLGRLRDGEFDYPMDNGSHIRVRIRVQHRTRSAVIDFSGTSAQTGDNFNAPPAISVAAVLYVFRCLVDKPIPLNAGCLKPLELRIPRGSLLDPQPPAAVVAGNVETSQCVTDALLGALGALAASQGTMNNFSFGNERYQYYETICGGAGAGPGFAGASAVHTHMTNSRLTDPEVLELRFPVRLESFHLRHGSGGRGAFPGGDGVVRRIRFLETMSASILSGHRRIAPFGLAGGAAGTVGSNYVVRIDGSIEPVGATATRQMAPGEVFVIETPGGGGYGTPEDPADHTHTAK